FLREPVEFLDAAIDGSRGTPEDLGDGDPASVPQLHGLDRREPPPVFLGQGLIDISHPLPGLLIKSIQSRRGHRWTPFQTRKAALYNKPRFQSDSRFQVSP